MRKVNTKNLTPENAWIEFVGTSEKMFLSNFRYEVPEMDIKKMCKIYAQELPIVFEYEGILFSDKQIEEIKNLLVTHLANYIKKNGGIENLELYTEEELDIMLKQDYEIILDGLSQKLGVSREDVKKALRRME